VRRKLMRIAVTLVIGAGTVVSAAPRIDLHPLHSFGSSEGTFPKGLMQASRGEFHGVLLSGGAPGVGTSGSGASVGPGQTDQLLPVVTADSVMPASGTGSSQMFALRYSDTAGFLDLSTTWVWFNASFAASAADSCLVYYNYGGNTLNLLNDAGTTWMTGILGAGGVLRNNQCEIALGSSSAVPTQGGLGDYVTLRLNLAMTFSPAFAGDKNICMYAASADSSSNWLRRGSWTVPGTGATVTADSVAPASGSGASQTFTLRYSDTAGFGDLTTTWVWFNATLASSAASSCLVYYDFGARTLSLLNNAGTQWQSSGVPEVGTLQNSQCSIQLATTTVGATGTTLTMTLSVVFKPAFAGAKNVYMYAANGSGANSGWQQRGTWSVAGSVVVTADSVLPSSGSGANQTFALQYSDTAGLFDLSSTWVWFNADFAASAAYSCLVYYDRAANAVSLLDDAGAVWQSRTVPNAGMLENGQCAIDLASTAAGGTGNTLTVYLAVIFKPTFAGARNIYMYATNRSVSSGWQTRGSWTAP